MKFKYLSFLLVPIVWMLSFQALAENKTTNWDKSSLPPTGYKPCDDSLASKAGKQLYKERNCASCHQIKGEGGTMGPPLDGIGGHRGKDFLIARLQNPLKQSLEFSELFGGKSSLMPHPGLSKRQAGQIAQYLLTLPEPQEGFSIQAHTQEPDTASKPEIKTKIIETPGTKLGAELFLEHGCAACHTTFDEDSRFGPTLKGISQRKSKEEIERLLSGKFKNSLMKKQAHELDPQEVRCITEFLLKLPVESKK